MTVETKRKRPRRRQQLTYRHRTNAVCVTVYDPTGSTIPAEVREQIAESVLAVSLANKLLINIALT